MPKMKTKSSAKKRFTLTGTGKLKRKHAFKNHILTKKSTKQKRRLTKSAIVDKTNVKRIKRMLAKEEIFEEDKSCLDQQTRLPQRRKERRFLS